MGKSVIVTGIRSNSEPTLGNYLGAILPMVDAAKSKAGEYQVNMFVPDLHSFTTPIEHGNLYKNTIHNLKVFVAAGLPVSHEDVYIYRQSYIPAHSELCWILSCFTYFGEASRMVEFKDKSKRLGDNQVTAGLFLYPVLMAADILLYNAEWVPVGEDQRQHLELARDLAQRFNNKFGNVFVVPRSLAEQQAFIDRDSSPRIRSLKTPESKMSKSVSDPAGTITLSDDPNEAADKIMSATTDSLGKINFDWQLQPGITNLLQILALLEGKPTQAVAQEWAGKSSYGELKTKVASTVSDFLSNFQQTLNDVDDDLINEKLAEDEKKMALIADQTLLKAQKAVGLRS